MSKCESLVRTKKFDGYPKELPSPEPCGEDAEVYRVQLAERASDLRKAKEKKLFTL